MTPVVTLTFDIRSWDINEVTPRYKMKLFPTYEGNRPSGLGGDNEHTYRQTNRGTTSINNIDNIDVKYCWIQWRIIACISDVWLESYLCLKCNWWFSNVVKKKTTCICMQCNPWSSKVLVFPDEKCNFLKGTYADSIPKNLTFRKHWFIQFPSENLRNFLVKFN